MGAECVFKCRLGPRNSNRIGYYSFPRDLGQRKEVEYTIDSIEQEYVAESLAARVWAEMNPNATPEEYERDAGWILDQPAESAYQVIRQWGPYYALLPERQPRWYQIGQYWPAVEYVLRVVLGIQ